MLAKKILDIFVDESGNFGDIHDPSRYCFVTLVFHDSEDANSDLIRDYVHGLFVLGADPEAMSFHTAPLIRQEDQFSAMSRNMRGKIFYQMLSLVRKTNLRFKSIYVDTAFVASESQIITDLTNQLHDFIAATRNAFAPLQAVRLFYDAGQKGVTRILQALEMSCPCRIENMQGVRQRDNIFLQIADFLCTVSLIERRIEEGQPFNISEKRFFGSPRDFKRNVIRKLAHKRL